MEHGRVRALGTVLAAQHPERQLRVVDHRGHYEPGPAQLGPMGPRLLRPRLSAQAPRPKAHVLVVVGGVLCIERCWGLGHEGTRL